MRLKGASERAAFYGTILGHLGFYTNISCCASASAGKKSPAHPGLFSAAHFEYIFESVAAALFTFYVTLFRTQLRPPARVLCDLCTSGFSGSAGNETENGHWAGLQCVSPLRVRTAGKPKPLALGPRPRMYLIASGAQIGFVHCFLRWI